MYRLQYVYKLLQVYFGNYDSFACISSCKRFYEFLYPFVDTALQLQRI